MDETLADRVRQRANDVCEYCRLPQIYDELTFEMDHIIARKHRGPTRLSNLALACFACNNHKGPNVAGIDPITGDVVRLFNPRRHRWAKHFAWNGGELVGLTPIGRVTVIVLEINLTYRVAVRESLRQEGLFPLD